MCHIYGHSMMMRASGKGKGEFYELRGASENGTLANTAVFIIAAALERIYTKGSRGTNKKTRGWRGLGAFFTRQKKKRLQVCSNFSSSQSTNCPFVPPWPEKPQVFFLRNGLISSFLLGAAEQENTLFIKEMLLYFLCIVRLW